MPSTLPAVPESAQPAPQSPSSRPGAERAAAVSDYRASLIELAERYKRYPRVAVDNNWEGRSVVRLVVGPAGAIASLTITTSASHRVLDRQALEMVRKAKEALPVPQALLGERLEIEIPVLFELKDR